MCWKRQFICTIFVTTPNNSCKSQSQTQFSNNYQIGINKWSTYTWIHLRPTNDLRHMEIDELLLYTDKLMLFQIFQNRWYVANEISKKVLCSKTIINQRICCTDTYIRVTHVCVCVCIIYGILYSHFSFSNPAFHSPPLKHNK